MMKVCTGVLIVDDITDGPFTNTW